MSSCNEFEWSLTTTDIITVGFILFKLFDTVSQVLNVFTRTEYEHTAKKVYPFRHTVRAFQRELVTVAVLVVLLVAAIAASVRGVYWNRLWDSYSPQRSDHYAGIWLCRPFPDEHATAHYTLYVVYFCVVLACVGLDILCILWALLISPPMQPMPQRVRVSSL